MLISTVKRVEKTQITGAPVKFTKKQKAEFLRLQVDTVGRPGKVGERIQNVIFCWNAFRRLGCQDRNSYHGSARVLRVSFSVKQVVGRGLRRTSYDDINPKTGLFEPEYVNIFWCALHFSAPRGWRWTAHHPRQHRRPQLNRQQIRRISKSPGRNVIRIDHNYRSRLSLEWQKLKPLQLNAAQTVKIAELAPVVEGKPDITKVEAIHLENLAREFRTQRIIFETARDVYDQMQQSWSGSKTFLLAQLVRLVEQFISSDKIRITPKLFL